MLENNKGKKEPENVPEETLYLNELFIAFPGPYPKPKFTQQKRLTTKKLQGNKETVLSKITKS